MPSFIPMGLLKLEFSGMILRLILQTFQSYSQLNLLRSKGSRDLSSVVP